MELYPEASREEEIDWEGYGRSSLFRRSELDRSGRTVSPERRVEASPMGSLTPDLLDGDCPSDPAPRGL